MNPLFYLDFCLIDGNIDDLHQLSLLATRDPRMIGVLLVDTATTFSLDECFYIVNDREANLLHAANRVRYYIFLLLSYDTATRFSRY